MVRKSVPHLAVLGLMGMLVQPALGAVHGEPAGTGPFPAVAETRG